MSQYKVEIGVGCNIVVDKWSENYKTVCLEYTERSPDAYYSDSETSHDIDSAKAAEIVALLLAEFPEIAPAAKLNNDAADARLFDLLKEARKIIRASSSRNLVKDWDERATAAIKQGERK